MMRQFWLWEFILASEDKENTSQIRMAQIKTETGLYQIVSDEQVANYAKTAKEKYPHNHNQN